MVAGPRGCDFPLDDFQPGGHLPPGQGCGHLGNQHPGGLGLGDYQFCLVDRDRPRWDADQRHSPTPAAEVAYLHQPFRGSHDHFCRGLRGDVSFAAHGPAMAFLLADAVSKHHGYLAAVPQPAGVGRVRGIHLRHGVIDVLVRGDGAGPGHAARPREKPVGAGGVRIPGHGLARVRGALAPLRDGLAAAGRAGHAPGALRPYRGELRLCYRD